jgi:hypothetical protein
MTFVKILLGLVVILFIGGFAFLAFTDVPVQHSQVTKIIPNDRFLNAQ